MKDALGLLREAGKKIILPPAFHSQGPPVCTGGA